MKKTIKILSAFVLVLILSCTVAFAVSAADQIPEQPKITLKLDTTYALSAKISWTKAPGSAGYAMYRYDTAKKTWSRMPNVYTNSATVTGLSGAKKHYFLVKPYYKTSTGYVYGSFSNTLSFYSAPYAMGAVTSSSITPTSVKLSWGKPTGTYAYEVYMSKDGGKTYSCIKRLFSQSYTVTGLNPSTNYVFKVRAYHLQNGSPAYGVLSAAKTVKTQIAMKLDTTYALSAKISWTKAEGAAGYMLYRYDTTKKTWIRQPNVYTNSATVTGISKAQKAYFVVRAYYKTSTGYKYDELSQILSFYGAPYNMGALTASSITQTSVKLSWSKPTGTYAFEVYMSKDGGKTYSCIKRLFSQSYTVTGLEANTKYLFKVRAYHLNNASPAYGTYSAAKTVQTLYNFKLDYTYATSAKFSWTAAKDCDGYLLFRYNSTTKGWDRLPNVYTNSATVTGLLNASKTSYLVRAYYKTSSGYVYDAFSQTFSFYSAPHQVTSWKITEIAGTSMNISWDKVPGGYGYGVYMSSNNGASYELIKVTAGLEYTVTGLKEGIEYRFAIKAYHKYNGYTVQSIYSPVKRASLSPTLTLGTFDDTSATFTWTEYPYKRGYQVYQYDSVGKTWALLSLAYTNSFTAKDLDNTKEYKFKVRQYELVDGEYLLGNFSNEITVIPATDEIKNIKVSNVTENSATVSWQAISGETYEIQEQLSSGQWLFVAGDLTQPSYELEDLDVNDLVTIRVKANILNEDGTDLNKYTKFTFKTAPEAPQALKVNALDNNSIKLSWTDDYGVDKNDIYVSNDNKTYTLLGSTISDSYIMTSIDLDKQYYFKVRSSHNYNEFDTFSAYSAPLELGDVLAQPTGVKEIATEDSSIKFTWNEVAGAENYAIYYYSYYSRDWIQTSTRSETSYSLSGLKGSNVYRVAGINENGVIGFMSEPITIKAKGVDLTFSDYKTTIAWDSISTATTYEVQQMDIVMNKWNTIKTVTGTSTSLYLAPGAISSIQVIAYNSSGTKVSKATDVLNFKTPDLKIEVLNDSKTNVEAMMDSLKSQTLFLTQAINYTKNYAGTITVDATSHSKFEITKIEVLGEDSDDMKDILNDLTGGELGLDETEKTSVTFTDGVGKTSDGKSALLPYSFTPFDNSAYLYNVQNDNDKLAEINPGLDVVKVFKNVGITTTFVKKLSNGDSQVNFTLTKEINTNNNHAGFVTTFKADDFSQMGIEGLKLGTISYGDTVISATVGSDGILKTLKITSPFSFKVTMDLSGFDGSIEFSGTTDYNYTFTK